MKTNIPEKLVKIAYDIEENGPQELTRLTVLKRWLADPVSLSSFAIFIAKRACSRKEKADGKEAELFGKSNEILKNAGNINPRIPVEKAKRLLDQLENYQDEYYRHKSAQIRIIRNRNLMLIEEGLRIFLYDANNPTSGYRLAVSYCENYDPAHGNMLDKKSLFKIKEIIRFMFNYEALIEFKK